MRYDTISTECTTFGGEYNFFEHITPEKLGDDVLWRMGCIAGKDAVGGVMPVIINDNFMSMRKGHPYLRDVVEFIDTGKYGSGGWCATGPIAYGKVFNAHKSDALDVTSTYHFDVSNPFRINPLPSGSGMYFADTTGVLARLERNPVVRAVHLYNSNNHIAAGTTIGSLMWNIWQLAGISDYPCHLSAAMLAHAL